MVLFIDTYHKDRCLVEKRGPPWWKIDNARRASPTHTHTALLEIAIVTICKQLYSSWSNTRVYFLFHFVCVYMCMRVILPLFHIIKTGDELKTIKMLQDYEPDFFFEEDKM